MNGAGPPRSPVARVREAGKHREAREWAKVSQLSMRQTPGWGRGTCIHRSAFFISVIPPQQRLKAPFLLKRRRVDLLKFTWVLENWSNYRKLYLQWASYFLVQRNKAFISCSLPLPVTAVEGNVFLNGALSGSEITEDSVAVGGWDSNLQSVWGKSPARPPHAVLSAFGVSLFFLSCLFVCLFLPRIYVPSHVLCAFFGFILHLFVVVF